MEKFWYIMLTAVLSIMASLTTSFINSAGEKASVEYVNKQDNEIKQSVKELDNKKVDKDVFELVYDGIKEIKEEQKKQRELLMDRR